MIIGAGQQVGNTALDPLFAFMPLALWAVTVAATVIADVYRSAICALIDMSAQCSCAALLNSAEGSALLCIESYQG